MKKMLFITALTAVSFGLIGCEATNTNKTENSIPMSNTTTSSASLKADNITTSEVSAVTTTQAETTTVSATSAEAAEISVPMNDTAVFADTDNIADWKTAYKKTLNDFMESEDFGEMSTWDIQDIDNDGTPELLISEAQNHITGVMFYYYDNGNAVPALDENGQPLQYGAYGGVFICPEESLIGIEDVKQGLHYTAMNRYEKPGTAFVQRTLENSGAVGKDNVTYTVNDNTVSETEYNSAYNEFVSKNWKAAGNQYKFDDLSVLE